MRPEDVPPFFAEQVKITKEHVGSHGVNNVFKRIELDEISTVTSFLFDEEEMKAVQHKADLWNISFNGEDHQEGDRIFWFYILSENGARILHTCNHRQFEKLLQNFEFVSYHDYQGLSKSTDAFNYLYEETKNTDWGFSFSLDKLFPIFKERVVDEK